MPKYPPSYSQLSFSEAEEECLQLSGTLADKFSKLPQLHPSDLSEFILHIHALQNILLARAAYLKEWRGGS